MKGQRILVTGGAGFIGSHLADKLIKTSDKVIVVDTMFLGNEANLRQAWQHGPEHCVLYREDAGDYLAMQAIVEKEQPQVIFNLATRPLLYSYFNSAGAYSVSSQIAVTLCELLRKQKYQQLVHISSSEVYGSAVTTPMDESHPLNPETTYAAGKAAADLVISSYVRMFAIPAFIIRPFNNFGPRQGATSLGAVIPLTISRVLAGEQPIIEGDGLQTRDFIFVADTVSAITRLAEEGCSPGEIFNIGSGKETSIREVITALCSIMDYTGPVTTAPPRSPDVRRHCADVGKVRGLIGNPSTTTLFDGLTHAVAWWKKKLEDSMPTR